MSHGTTGRRPVDTTRISLNEGWEVCFWTRELDASEEELVAAMRQVGPGVEAVRGYFRRQYQSQYLGAGSPSGER